MTGPDQRVRERFAATGAVDAPMPRTILASWSRSRSCGAGPDRREAPYGGPAYADSRLRRAAQPVLELLAADLVDTPTALLLSDPHALVVRRWTSERAMARLMDRVRAAEGFVLSEDTVGTNGVGTPLEEERPVAVVGTAHYNEIFDEASCAGAPLRHPVTGRVEGVVSLTCRADAANPLQLPLIAGAAREVERRLLEAASATERQLLESFTAARHRTARPVLCVGEDVVLATPTAARLLEGVSQGLLWERVVRAVAGGDGERVCELVVEDDTALLGRCRAVRDGDATVGVVVAIEPPPAARRRVRPRPASLPGLRGRSAAWRAAVAAATESAAAGTPLFLWGEPGTGKAALARAVAAQQPGTAPVTVLDAALEAAEGARAWLGRARTARGTIVVRHVDTLAPATMTALAALLAADPGGDVAADPAGGVAADDGGGVAAAPGAPGGSSARPWFVATAADPDPAVALGARAVELPPLRARPEDVAPVAEALLRRHGRPGFRQRLRPDALQLLERLPWPGNVRELEQALRSALARRRAGDLRPEDLPAELRAQATRAPLTGLQRLEAEAIARALAACGGNKREAARELGIARSTLYRKLRAYGLELERRAF